MDKLTTLGQIVNQALISAGATFETWQKGLAKDPTHSMEWSGRAFEAAAQIEVYGEVVLACQASKSGEGKATIASIQEYALDRVVHGSAHPKRSTSPFANEIDRDRIAAWTQVFRWTQDIQLMEESE